MRFYGVGSDPAWPERAPRRLLFALLRQLPVLAAQETMDLINAISIPWMDKYDRRHVLAAYRAAAYPEPPRPRRRVRVVEHDPEKAAAYFRARGVRVVHKGQVN